MYDYIKGVFTYKIANSKGCFATVETGGIGYRFEIMERDYTNLPEIGTELKIFSILLHREDKMSFCGFLRREDRDIFNILTSVSGVGSKMALVLLNSFEVSNLVGFVLDGNYKELTRAKGVGPKLAQKIILELKDKLTNYQSGERVITSSAGIASNSQNTDDARMVLVSLGYNNEEINSGLSKALERLTKEASAEEILKEALRVLSV
ncbi:Holliday junction branch migration protein RuvA [bacterium]|nr:Holliday junction branch migration protein RuvA [bacterium]